MKAVNIPLEEVIDIELHYRHFYLLSFFQEKKETTLSQLLHVFQGKRTPSMFYLAEINQWHHVFSQFKSISSGRIEKMIQPLLDSGWLGKTEKGYERTEKGKSVCRTYFEDHYFPSEIKGFANLSLRRPFWERLQLFVQVFSEMSYGHSSYTPVIKHPHHQENIRQLLQQFQTEKETLQQNWVKEQLFLFHQMEEERADILTRQLTGHQRVGDTKAQSQENMGMEPLEYFFYHQDSIELMIRLIEYHATQVPIINAMLGQLRKETNFGLSASTNQTYQLIKQGYSVSDIATERHLKENTIREHILEMAFVLEEFPYSQFVPEKIYSYLNERFDEDPDLAYQKVVFENDSVEFMHYRLVELERLRKL